MKLSSQQYSSFFEDGYVVIPSVLGDADISPLIQSYNEEIDTLAQELFAQNRIPELFEDQPFETRLVNICKFDEETYRTANEAFDLMYIRTQAIFEFLRNQNLLDIIEGILGPEITCSPIQHVRCKLPASLWDGTDSYKAPWHQDAQVHTEDADPHFILTVWIPLCDTDEQNGCLQVIPKGHQSSTVYWSQGFGISSDNLPQKNIISLPMKKGDVLLVHKLTPHASEPNQTNAIRWSLDLRYQKSGTPTGRSCYPDFIARSHQNPESELRDYTTWDQLWQEALEEYPIKTPREHKPDRPVHQNISL